MKRTFTLITALLLWPPTMVRAQQHAAPASAPTAPSTPAASLPLDARTEPPVIITAPGREFQDDARPGAMIIGMDRTPQGRIWGCWTGTGDKPDGYFILATSDDDGGSWSKPRLIVSAPDRSGKRQRGALVGNLWTDPLGRLWLFFDQAVVGLAGPRGNWFIRCDHPDADAPAWSEPVCFAEGCTLNKPTVLKNGDWLLPVSHWAEKTARVYASTDQGQTWNPRGSVKFPEWEFDEHMLVELRDGRLWMLARTKGNPHESFSTDQAATWTEPQPSAIQNVNARFFLRRLASGRLLLVKNGPPSERLTKRSHMSAFLSDDDGQTWRGGLLLDERSSVSYPDGFQAPDGLIHILYDWNRHTDAEILLAKFREEDVLAGALVSQDAKLRLRANKATGPKPILYNGIELPLEWPPRQLDPQSTEPLPVPYLRRPPKTIPVDVGRQLLVDDFLVESTTLQRSWHQPEKFAGNPVLKPETPLELQDGRCPMAAPFSDGVFFDPRDRLFKLWYHAGWFDGTALATSRDGLQWQRGNDGHRLIPDRDQQRRDGLSIWLDQNATCAAERFKMFLFTRTGPLGGTLTGGAGHLLSSPDGVHWDDRGTTGPLGDNSTFFYNPFRQKWVFSIRSSRRARTRDYWETDDFFGGPKWGGKPPVFWAATDKLDRPDPALGDTPQLYKLDAVAYESLMLGLFEILSGPSNRKAAAQGIPKVTELQVAFSRDGFHWDRSHREPFIWASRKPGDWERGYISSAGGCCLVVGDKLHFYYGAFQGNEAHRGGNEMWSGMYANAATGLATLRRDGFASLDAGEKTGTLTTRPLRFQGQHLFVNLDAPRGELRVEVLTLDGKPYGPFTAENCVPLSCDSTRQRVTWRGAESLARASGKNVRLRFTLTGGSLYAFWVTPDENGASHGYVAAGGPGFNGPRDDAGSQQP